MKIFINKPIFKSIMAFNLETPVQHTISSYLISFIESYNSYGLYGPYTLYNISDDENSDDNLFDHDICIILFC